MASNPSSRRILVFGAAAHIGQPLADFIVEQSPGTRLRLATTSETKREGLQARYPSAETIVADYFDEDSMTAALADVNGVFVVTPDFFDEITAMEILVSAARRSGSVDHIVRILADTPGMSLKTMPRELRDLGPGPVHQHFEARSMLNASGLPVTYLNSQGYYMDDLLTHFAHHLKTQHKLLIPFDRKMCWTDTSELGEAAARLLLDGPEDHAGRYYHFNSGEPPRMMSDVAAMVSKATGVRVTHDGDSDVFVSEIGPYLRQLTGSDRAATYFVVNWKMESDAQDSFFGSDWAGQILGREPLTFDMWLEKHKDQLV